MIEYKKFMKNNKFTLVFCIVIIMFLCLCSFKHHRWTSDCTRPSGLKITEIKMNGHFYIVATRRSPEGGVSIIHSPDCNCNRH